MKRNPLTALVLFAVFITLSQSILADGDNAHDTEHSGVAEVSGVVTNEYCPVMPDEKVDPEIHVDYEGKTVYLCCKMCRRDFLESPEQYLTALPQFVSNSVSGTSTAPETSDGPGHSHVQEGASSESHDHRKDQEEHAHDHVTDHGNVQNLPARVIRFGGKFHPVVVHFPIALTIIALLAEVLFVFRKEELFRSAGRFCIVASALGALVAATLGWAAASSATYPSLELTLAFHRWLGTGAALLVVGCAILSEAAARKGNRRLYWSYFVALTVGSVIIGVVGHLGATLIYGPDHFGF
jgi:uncharacterized membrane protein/YHS domain-containing protein